jgi:basic amino acid/polyamine antiporter, APA family
VPRARAEQDAGLVRAIGVRTLAANAINLTVGAGIFVLPAIVAGELGSAAAIAYLVCALAMCLVLLCYAESGSRVSRSGGSYAYVEAAFGPYAGFLVGTLLWFAFGVLSDAAIANALFGTLAAAFPEIGAAVPRAFFFIILFGGLAFINILGVRQGARFAVTATLVKLVPLLALVLVGLTAVRAENLAWSQSPSLPSLGDASLVLFFAFAGAESALTASGEIRDPARTVPRGILLGTAGVVALYLGLHVVAQGVLGPELAQQKDAPLAAAAERVLGSAGRSLLLAGAALSMFGTLAGDMLATPRALFAAGRDGFLPRPLGAVHPRFRTPYVAIATYAALICAFAISGAFRQLASASSAGLLMVYLAMALATLELRRRDVRIAKMAFRLPGGPLVPLLACAVVVWLLSHTTRTEAYGLGLLLLAATAVYVIGVVSRSTSRRSS